ncbi:hypothetical protein GKQ23_14360 [Erwinia sp. E602]|uniref:hypothetical protein n=1 Tax=Erwinia sp. E602 TaxID=2675378 RepID=UPI001BA6381C|nr:hypothetical protein [Erwinia sp. E602]QUG76110.1 hypothetical protein GKQ23_14360 [Erwinia sp. E602]
MHIYLFNRFLSAGLLHLYFFFALLLTSPVVQVIREGDLSPAGAVAGVDVTKFAQKG